MLKPGPKRKPRHTLSAINVKKMTADCAVCGQTVIHKRKVWRTLKRKVKLYTVYICATHKRQYAAEYRRLNFASQPRINNPSFHNLSEIDDENKTAVCSRCGPVVLYISHSGNRIFRRCRNARRENEIKEWERKKQAKKRSLLKKPKG